MPIRRRALLLVLLAGATPPASAQEPSSSRPFEAAERAKAAGDFAAMAARLKELLAAEAGTEYQWRSLAWAEARRGLWRESLAHARENVRRHGDGDWPVRQLCDSAFCAGDLALVAETLRAADLRRAGASRPGDDPFAEERRRLAALTRPRRYELTWRVPPPAEARPVRLLMPARRHPGQTFDVVAIEGAASAEAVVVDGRDFLDLTFRDGEPVVLKATLVHEPIVRGAERLESLPAAPLPEELRPLLLPFTNRVRYDPAHRGVVALAPVLARPTPAASVQAVLDWLRDELRYEFGHDDSLDAILSSKRGVCHHYANLFVTLCRAVGVPALVAHGVRLPDAGAFVDHGGSHGWAEAYVAGLGWTPVEPLDAGSLRAFGGAGYLFFDISGRGVEDDHFRFTSLQGVPVSGRVVDP